MPWVPQYVITNGALKGSTPEGSLDDLTHYFVSNFITETAGCHSNGPRYYDDNDDPYISWSGAYGSNGLLIRDYAPTGSRFLFAELPVDKKEDAAFWKQTICVYGEIGKTEHTRDGNTYYEYAYELTGFTRKVYQNEGDTIPISEETLYSVDSGMRYIIGFYDGVIPRYNAEFKVIDIAFGWITIGQERYWGCAFYCIRRTELSGINIRMSNGCYLMGVSETQLKNRFDVDIFQPGKKDDPNDDDEGDSDEGGGNGDHDKTEDNIPVPPAPTIGAADAGFITLYRMNNVEINLFAQTMVDPDVWAAIKAFFMDPMDFITGIMLVPFTPPSTRTAKPAFYPEGTYYDVISSEFVDVDCGSLAFPKFYDSAFDFNPYSKYILYLPYIGYVELDADEVAGEIIHVKYRCDCLTGDCIAFVYKVNPVLTQVIAQYSGNCGVRVPYGRTSFDAAIAASIQLLGGGIGMAVGAAASAAGLQGGEITAGQLASQASNATVTSVNGMKVTTERSGVSGASAGYMSIQKPHLIRNIPHQSLPENYRRLNGYPSNIGGSLGDFSGFTAVESIELSGIGATDAEKDEILTLLTRGVIV